MVATIYLFAAPMETDFLAFFDQELAPAVVEAGASIAASFVTEESPNDVPALPVREGEHVFVWFAAFPGPTAYDAHLAARDRSSRWSTISEELDRRLAGKPAVLRLLPTARSLLGGSAPARSSATLGQRERHISETALDQRSRHPAGRSDSDV